MKLIVHELVDHLDQKIKVPFNSLIYGWRLHLYRHKHPAGSVKVKLLDANEKLISQSGTVLISDLDINGVHDFFHGVVTFELKTPLKKDAQVIVRLQAVGYTFDQSAFIGWCKHERPFAYAHDYAVSTNDTFALQHEAWGTDRSRRI